MSKILTVGAHDTTAALCSILRANGYETVAALDQEAALQTLRSSGFAAMFVEISATHRVDVLLRDLPALNQDLVCIAVVDVDALTHAVAALQAGALNYIIKPFTAPLLLATLTQALEIHRLRAENSALQQRVEAANHELDAFSYSVSHDLRAPLRAVRGFSQILLDDYADKLPEDATQLMRKVADGAARMNQLMEGLLQLARLAGHSLTPQQVDMATLARDVTAELGSDHNGATAEVVVEELPAINGDAVLLRQALRQLLSNAYKFTRHRPTPRIEVGHRRDGNRIVYFVRDNGVGFDMAHADRLFGVFQRLHPEKEFEGIGIGLALVQKIARKHGGQAWGEAALDRGATFYLELPQ